MEIDKREMQVTMRGRGQCKVWKNWIHKQNFRSGGDCLMGVEKIIVLDG